MCLFLVRSMTGFGRGVVTTESHQLTVEVRSVNHRFLEIHTKFPKEWMESEILAKKLITERFARGKFDIHIFLKEIHTGETNISIDWPLLEGYIQVKNKLAENIPLKAEWSMQEIMALDDVLIIEQQEISPDELAKAVEQALAEAIAGLLEMRVNEGGKLLEVLVAHIGELQQLIERIHEKSNGAVQKYRERLKERIEQFTDGRLLDDRLLTEVAIFAERIDISEELDRLQSHFKQFLETLRAKEAIGRKLDFLMQEMHREINTIGSKNQSAECSIAVVEAKAIVEKMREQVQNIE